MSWEIPKAPPGPLPKEKITIPENNYLKPKKEVLEEAGLTQNEASLNERLAAIPEEKFEEIIAVQHDKERYLQTSERV